MKLQFPAELTKRTFILIIILIILGLFLGFLDIVSNLTERLGFDQLKAQLTPLAIFDGNVGIGVSSPTQKLDVAGFVKARQGLCIGEDCRTGWPSGGSTTIASSSFIGMDVPVKTGCRIWHNKLGQLSGDVTPQFITIDTAAAKSFLSEDFYGHYRVRGAAKPVAFNKIAVWYGGCSAGSTVRRYQGTVDGLNKFYYGKDGSGNDVWSECFVGSGACPPPVQSESENPAVGTGGIGD